MFFSNIRRVSALLISGSILMVTVDSPSSSSLSFPGLPALDPHTSFDPGLNGTEGDARPALALDFDDHPVHDDEVEDLLAFVIKDPDGLLFDPFDLSDLTKEVLDVVGPALFAVARAMRTDSGAIGSTIMVEFARAVLYNGAFRLQKELGAGEEMGRVHGVLSSAIFRALLSLVFGVLGRWASWATVSRHKKRIRGEVRWFLRQLDVWAGRQLHCTVLALLLAADPRPAIFTAISDVLLVSCMIVYLFDSHPHLLALPNLRARVAATSPVPPPPPPPPPLPKKKKKKNRWY
ncbi:hypothetical protein DFH06DRAFT_540072 [Mycena polygramma]|nr:hypothetical protein DFH06DRAFT_540072 [Mycena polygramma]